MELGDDVMEIMPLGSGCEVGRSSVVVKFKGSTIMFDCGVHPGRSGYDALPFFDEIDPAEVDLLLVTHFHMDHCGAVPYFLQKTTFAGRVFMTHPTKARRLPACGASPPAWRASRPVGLPTRPRQQLPRASRVLFLPGRMTGADREECRC